MSTLDGYVLRSTEGKRPKTKLRSTGWICQHSGYSRMQINRLAELGKIPGMQPQVPPRSHRRFADSPALREFVRGLRDKKKKHFMPKPEHVRSYIPEDVPTPADPPANDLVARLRDANTAEEKSIRQLANSIAELKAQMGESAVNDLLEEEGISHQKMMRVRALLALPAAADETLRHLSSKHAVVVVKAKELKTDTKRIFWLKKAKNYALTPLQLRRSIMAGKLVTNEDVRIASGRGSGILTIEGVVFQAGRWYKHIQKADPIGRWQPEKARECLTKVKLFSTIINALIAAASSKAA